MLASTWSVVRLTVGTLLMVIGVLGTILPIIPGIPVFFAGLAVAGSSHPVTRFVRRRWEMWRAWRRPEGARERRGRRHALRRPGAPTPAETSGHSEPEELDERRRVG
jgi:hypothetical protein